MAEKVRLKITKEAYAGGFTYQPGEEVEMAFGAARVLIAQGVAVDADAPAAPKKKAARKPAKKQA